MKAKSFQVEIASEVESALASATMDGFAPTVAFVFMSVGPDIELVCAPFNKHGIQVFGGHSNGEFIDGRIKEHTIAVMLLDLDPEAFFLSSHTLGQGDEHETMVRLARQALDRFDDPVFMLLSSHLETNAEDLLAGIESVVGEDAQVYGAMAGMDFVTHGNAVFTNSDVLARGVVAMVFEGARVSISGIATCGWKAVGAVKTVTQSDGLWLEEIDGEPALDLMLKYAGLSKEEVTQEEWLTEYATALVPQLIREEGATVMRPSLVFDKERSAAMCNGRVPVGSKIRFSLPPDDDVIDAVIEGCKSLKATSAPEADAVVYFSCAGRFMSLGPLMKREVETVQALWNVPLVGMFSTGELARATGGRLELNNLTSCCVVLKER